jgi:hypothetical protein
MDNSRILVIPDLHFPYAHIDCLNFLSAIKKKYKPTRIILLGDELDFHALSFHDKDPDLDSAGRELEKSLGYMETLIKMFPSADVMESNHGSMFYRKAKHHGMPRHLLKSYNEVLNAPKSWKWHKELIITLPNGGRCKFVHGVSANVLVASQSVGMSLVQGHHHSLFELRYWDNGDKFNFAATSGCLIDDQAYSFAYNKLQIKRPILGAMVILDSIPHLIPMTLDKKKRWTGDL